jgi:hypothetical protein
MVSGLLFLVEIFNAKSFPEHTVCVTGNCGWTVRGVCFLQGLKDIFEALDLDFTGEFRSIYNGNSLAEKTLITFRISFHELAIPSELQGSLPE